jgi:hypothetical protein
MSAGSGRSPKTLERVMRSSRKVNVDTLEYYEGVDLTPAEAHRVLDEHGVSDYYQFWDEVTVNERGCYEATDVFIWLGY